MADRGNKKCMHNLYLIARVALSAEPPHSRGCHVRGQSCQGKVGTVGKQKVIWQ